MFFNSSLFWFLMGIVFVLVAAAFQAFARDRGWRIVWWKVLLALLCYGIFMMSFYAWGTLMGENEGIAGLKILYFGLFISIFLGAVTWRLLSNPSKKSVRKE